MFDVTELERWAPFAVVGIVILFAAAWGRRIPERTSKVVLIALGVVCVLTAAYWRLP